MQLNSIAKECILATRRPVRCVCVWCGGVGVVMGGTWHQRVCTTPSQNCSQRVGAHHQPQPSHTQKLLGLRSHTTNTDQILWREGKKFNPSRTVALVSTLEHTISRAVEPRAYLGNTASSWVGSPPIARVVVRFDDNQRIGPGPTLQHVPRNFTR